MQFGDPSRDDFIPSEEILGGIIDCFGDNYYQAIEDFKDYFRPLLGKSPSESAVYSSLTALYISKCLMSEIDELRQLIKEKDAQIKEKDAQIKQLLDILSKR